MQQNFWQRFVELATQLRTRYHRDEFFASRVKLAFWYIFIAIFVVIVFVFVIDYYTREAVFRLVTPETSVEELARHVVFVPWFVRIFRMVFLGACLVLLYHFLSSSQEHVAKRQRRFIGGVSHEIQTPLAIMKLQAQIALRDRDTIDRETLLAIVADTLEEVERLSQITRFFVMITHVEQGQPMPQRILDLGDVVRRVTVPHYLDTTTTSPEVRLEIGQDAYPVYGHLVSLEELVMNLVRNALAHTTSTGVVTVLVGYTADGRVSLTVQDTGVGIPPEELPYIFEPFYRGREVQRPDGARAGLGLGLHIVNEVVKFHHGTISVHSKIGAGSEFTVEFPAAI